MSRFTPPPILFTRLLSTRNFTNPETGNVSSATPRRNVRGLLFKVVINAGTKLLSQLYRQYGNWDDAFSAYNGGADAVRGLRTGNWGVWSDNPNKQREINQYASRVNSYRTAWNS